MPRVPYDRGTYEIWGHGGGSGYSVYAISKPAYLLGSFATADDAFNYVEGLKKESNDDGATEIETIETADEPPKNKESDWPWTPLTLEEARERLKLAAWDMENTKEFEENGYVVWHNTLTGEFMVYGPTDRIWPCGPFYTLSHAIAWVDNDKVCGE